MSYSIEDESHFSHFFFITKLTQEHDNRHQRLSEKLTPSTLHFRHRTPSLSSYLPATTHHSQQEIIKWEQHEDDLMYFKVEL